MVVKFLAHKPHLTARFWGLAYLHAADLLNILPNRETGISPHEAYYGSAPDLQSNPILPFGSIIMSQLPLEHQTALSGRAVETCYVGRASSHAGAILVFNPQTSRVLVRHSFKYLSATEPVSSTYVFSCVPDVPEPDTIFTSPNTPLDEIVEDSDDSFTFVPVTYSKCNHSYQFAFEYAQKTFVDLADNTSYRIHDVVRLSSANTANVYFFRYYDTALFPLPPTQASDFEYEAKNYQFTTRLPVLPNHRIRRINMVHTNH
jgi:hypothetical protein